jgi:transcriptional regulator with XRE-family HTH domain
MKLKDYIYFNGYNMKEFAQAVGCSRNYLRLIINREYRPSLRMARMISNETDGEVSINEIRGPETKMKEIFGED